MFPLLHIKGVVVERGGNKVPLEERLLFLRKYNMYVDRCPCAPHVASCALGQSYQEEGGLREETKDEKYIVVDGRWMVTRYGKGFAAPAPPTCSCENFHA